MKKTLTILALSTAATLASAQSAASVTLEEVVAEKTFADCVDRQTKFLGEGEVSFGSMILGKAFVAGMVCGAPEKVSPHLSQELRAELAAKRELCRVDVTTCEGYVAGEVAGDE